MILFHLLSLYVVGLQRIEVHQRRRCVTYHRKEFHAFPARVISGSWGKSAKRDKHSQIQASPTCGMNRTCFSNICWLIFDSISHVYMALQLVDAQKFARDPSFSFHIFIIIPGFTAFPRGTNCLRYWLNWREGGEAANARAQQQNSMPPSSKNYYFKLMSTAIKIE